MTFLLLMLGSGIAGGLVFYFMYRVSTRRRVMEELGMQLFLLKFSKGSTEGAVLKQEIAKSEQLLAALAAFKKPFVLEVAVPYVGESIRFYIAVPGKMSEAVMRQIQSIWDDVQMEAIGDYNIFNYGGVTLGAWVKQKTTVSLPIRTYAEVEADTFLPMLGGLTKVNEIGEGGAIQFVFLPAPHRKKEIRLKLVDVKKGKKIEGKMNPLPSAGDIMKGVLEGYDEKKLVKEEERQVDDPAVRAIENKLSKPLFEVNVRLLASAANQYQAESILDGLAAGFSQFGAPDRNELQVIRPRNPMAVTHAFSFRSFAHDQVMVLTSEEAVSLFHFPTPFTDIPRIDFLRFREAEPPVNLGKEGIILGESRYRGVRREVRMSREDRRRHLYIVGQTGTGKSVLLNDLSGQDVRSGEGVCVIDPNGDLFSDVLSRVPKSRIEKLVVFDPSDIERPLGLNMLEYDPRFPEHKTFIVNELLNIFNTLYDMKTAGGPMFEQYMRNVLLLLMDDPEEHMTLLEVPRVLADAAFRKRLLAKCRNVVTKDFWEKEAEKAGGEASLANMVPYITSKFNTFIANDYVRPIISQEKSSINFREILDGGKILLVNLSKGRIGDLNASLLGMIIVGKLTLAAFSRDDMPQEKRRDFYLYIDEFQNFTTPSIATILSEARKYRLCLTMAHQFIGQLSDDIKNAVFGNVGSIVAFRVGADDAEFLKKQFEPVFSSNDLINIDNFNAHAKLIVGGQVTRPFNIFIPFPEKGAEDIARIGREFSRLTYGRNRMEIEAEILGKLRT